MVICLHNEIHLVTKMNTFIIVFISMVTSVWRSKKQNSFSFWYIYTCLIVRLHRWKSLSFRRECLVRSAQSGPAVPTASCSPFLFPVRRWAGPEPKRRWRAEQVRRVVLAMYTFMVGPWLWHSSTISSGPGHTPAGGQWKCWHLGQGQRDMKQWLEMSRWNKRGDRKNKDRGTRERWWGTEKKRSCWYVLIRQRRWPPLCLLQNSSRPQRSPRFLCNCGPTRLSGEAQQNQES